MPRGASNTHARTHARTQACKHAGKHIITTRFAHGPPGIGSVSLKKKIATPAEYSTQTLTLFPRCAVSSTKHRKHTFPCR